MRTVVATLFLLLVGAPCLHADMSVKAYKEMKASDANDPGLLLYVKGLGEGILWANASAERRMKPLYCAPGKLALMPSNFIDIIDRQIDKVSKVMAAKDLDEQSVGLLLMTGLEETFPCPAK